MLKLQESETTPSSVSTPRQTSSQSSLDSPVAIRETTKAKFRYPVYRWILYPILLFGTAFTMLTVWREPSLQVTLAGLGMVTLTVQAVLDYKISRHIYEQGSGESLLSYPSRYFLQGAGCGLITVACLPFWPDGGVNMWFPMALFALQGLFWGCFHTWERRQKSRTKAER